MKILTFASLFPNLEQPSHGIFVEHRLRQLVAFGGARAQVVAPVPWFPWRSERFGLYGKYARVPALESRHGLSVIHPRYPVVPKVGMNLAPSLLFRAMKPVIRRVLADGFDFDVLDSHFFYPDGIAAVMLGKEFHKPVVVTGRGSDLNFYTRFRYPRRRIRWAAQNADAVVTVASALKECLVGLGIPDQKVRVLRNGVDLDLFRPPKDRQTLRANLGITSTTLLSVGNLIELKGHHLVIAALPNLPRVNLMVLGDGPQDSSLRAQTARLRLEDRVRFVGRVSQAVLKDYYGAADALVLASSREGWANVLLESMACGTPAVATPVGGTPEVLTEPAGGLLSEDRSVAALVAAVRKLLDDPPQRAATRAYAEGFSWDETSQGQLDLFRQVRACRTRTG